METVLEFIREILKGIVRELTAHFFRNNVLENKTPPSLPSQAKGWFAQIIDTDNHHPDGSSCREKCYQHFSFLII
ncbi:hypothetical protein BGM25_03765 [Bacillus sp. FJAT-29953]|nr:hypothetical protein [Bacillus sp. FJAT-29953]